MSTKSLLYLLNLLQSVS